MLKSGIQTSFFLILIFAGLSSGCQPRDAYLRRATNHAPLPSQTDPKEERLKYFARHALREGGPGQVVLHHQTFTTGHPILQEYLKDAGDQASANLVAKGLYGFSLSGSLAGLAWGWTLSYLLASPFENARDNTLWRDGALIGIPVGAVFGGMSQSHIPGLTDDLVRSHNGFLLDALGVTEESQRQEFLKTLEEN